MIAEQRGILARRDPALANYTLVEVGRRGMGRGYEDPERMERGLRLRPGNVALRAIDGRQTAGAVPGFIGDGERRYEIVREISRGGMGTVHLGLLRGPLGFAKNVAIKAMHAQDVADPQIAKIFAAEARLTAGLCHANIVSTLDVLVEAGSVFIVMEYIDGSSLSEMLGLVSDFGHLLPISVSCAIIHDTLLGLAHAHDAGIIHCDISPQNILVGSDGLARVLDFGIAKVMSSARHAVPDEDNTEVRGKVPYMAPEQLRGGKMDHRVDLYAAGATLWEMLTGRRLFRGGSRSQIAANVLDGNVEPPSRYLPEVPPALDAFVMQATQRDPRARFRSAREMANVLATCAPLATRADVMAAMRRLDVGGTPGSGIRALSPSELAIRRHARALRDDREGVHTPPVIIAELPPPAAGPEGEGRRTTMSKLRREKAKKQRSSSWFMRVAAIALVGVALGAGQAAFDVIPIEPYLARVLPPKTPPAPPKPTAPPTAVMTATPTAPPVMTVAPTPTPSETTSASAAPEPPPKAKKKTRR